MANLKSIPIRLESSGKARRIVHLTETCVVLHNLCIADGIPQSWLLDDNAAECGDEGFVTTEDTSSGVEQKQQLFELFTGKITLNLALGASHTRHPLEHLHR
jgi:hypothetical protein